MQLRLTLVVAQLVAGFTMCNAGHACHFEASPATPVTPTWMFARVFGARVTLSLRVYPCLPAGPMPHPRLHALLTHIFAVGQGDAAELPVHAAVSIAHSHQASIMRHCPDPAAGQGRLWQLSSKAIQPLYS